MMGSKNLLLVIGIIVFISGLGAQADSLRQALTAAPLNDRARIMNQLARTLLRSEPAQALQYATSAVKLALELNQAVEAADAMRIQGNYQFFAGNHAQALEHYQKALPFALKTTDNKLLGDIYNNIGQTQTQLDDLKAAEVNLLLALKHRKRLPSRDSEIAALISLGQVYWLRNDYHKALEQYNAAASLLEKTDNPKLASTNFNNMGNAYLQTGDIAKALEAYIRSLELKKQFGGDKELAAASHSIGNLFYRIGEHEKALSYYLSARQLYQKSGDADQASQVDGNLGVVYNSLGEYDKALSHHLSALTFYRRHGEKAETAKTLNNLGNVFQNKKNYPQAIDYYLQSRGLKSELDDQEGLAVTEKNLGDLYYHTSDYSSALRHTQASLEISKRLQNKLLLSGNYRQLSRIQSAMGDHADALTSLEKFVELDEELHKQESLSAIAEMVNRLDTQERIKEISELRGDKEQKEAELKRLARHRLFLIIAAILGSAFSISLIVLYLQKKREIHTSRKLRNELETLNLELEDRIKQEMEKFKLQQQAINQKSKLESLGILAAGIAHEINQPLSAISLSIDNIANKNRLNRIDTEYLSRKSIRMQADVERIQKIIEHVRLFSRFQSDEAIEQVDINSTIQDAITIFEPVMRKSRIRLSTSLCPEQAVVLGNRFKLEQVLFNLLSNAKDSIIERAAHQDEDYAGSIGISSVCRQDRVKIQVRDDGSGIPSDHISKIFDPFFTTKQPDKGTGLGLAISYGIINEMDGGMSVQSEPGKGSSFEIDLPLMRS